MVVARISLFLILLVEIFALFNRGGGPLLSHLFLTGIVFLIIAACVIFPQKMKFQFGLMEAGYAFFLLFFVCSLIFSLTPSYGLSEFLLFTNAFILLFILSSVEISRRDLSLFSIFLVSIAVIDVLIGFFIYTRTPFPRLVGTFIDLKEPYASFGNDFADFILIILPVALAFFFRPHARRTTTILSGFACAILLAGFLLSFSRGAWIAGFALLVLAGAWRFVQRRRVEKQISAKNFALRAAVLVFAVVILVNALQFSRGQRFQTDSVLDKALFRADEGSASAGDRLQFWKGSIDLIKDRPVLGGGILSFKYLFPKYQQSFGIAENHPHNIFLKIGVENGIFAVIFFVIFLVAVGFILLRFIWKNPDNAVFPFILGALGALGHNLIDFNLIAANFILFIVFISLPLSFAKTSAPQASPQKILFLHPLLIISFALLGLSLHEGFYNVYFNRGRAALAQNKLDSAIFLLEKADNLFFKRDLANYLSVAYRKQYSATKNLQWRRKELDLLMDIARQTVDANLIARLGELYMEDKAYSKAQEFFEKAVRMDPENHFSYYYKAFDAGRSQKKQIDAEMKNKALGLLSEYVGILRKNSHFTTLTDNPYYASKLYEFFNMQEEKAQIDKIWFEEMLKFAIRYGNIPKPLL